MQTFLCFFVFVTVLSIGRSSDVPSTDDTSRSYNNYNDKEKSLDLHVNFTFPANGLPPLKLNLGNVARYLNDQAGSSYSSYPSPRVVLVNITNPNKPVKSIPADVYAKGLPSGALIPGDLAKPCRSLIVSKCKKLCLLSRKSCVTLCDGRPECHKSCKKGEKSCKLFCNSTFKKITIDETPRWQAYLPKCLRNCRGDLKCNAQCHKICHTLLLPASVADVLPVANNLTAAVSSLLSNTTSSAIRNLFESLRPLSDRDSSLADIALAEVNRAAANPAMTNPAADLSSLLPNAAPSLASLFGGMMPSANNMQALLSSMPNATFSSLLNLLDLQPLNRASPLTLSSITGMLPPGTDLTTVVSSLFPNATLPDLLNLIGSLQPLSQDSSSADAEIEQDEK